jgi:hypothetical protein
VKVVNLVAPLLSKASYSDALVATPISFSIFKLGVFDKNNNVFENMQQSLIAGVGDLPDEGNWVSGLLHHT